MLIKIFLEIFDNIKLGKHNYSFRRSIYKTKIIRKTNLIFVSLLSLYEVIILNVKKNQIINLKDI